MNNFPYIYTITHSPVLWCPLSALPKSD